MENGNFANAAEAHSGQSRDRQRGRFRDRACNSDPSGIRVSGAPILFVVYFY